MNKTSFLFVFAFAGLLASCGNNSSSPTPAADSTVSAKTGSAGLPNPAAFRDSVDGKPTGLYILKGRNGMTAAITNYGARLVSLLVPDKHGVLTDVVDGYDNIGNYLHQPETFFGAVVGRYGNRIAKGKFKLDGKEYTLAVNNPPNSLHGGVKGFDKVIWNVEEISVPEGPALKLTYLSKDMEEGFPGNLHAEVIYILDDNNELKFIYRATTDKATVINLTQ